MKKVAVIGAGPAGLTTAYELSKSDQVEVKVFEASDCPGGLSKSIDLWGHTVDMGPHRFFSSDARVNKLWLEVIGDEYRMVNRLTRIYYKDKYFNYPLKAMNALLNLGVPEATRCMLSYMSEKISPTPLEGDFETWVRSRFGKRLFEIFFKSYSEKLWGVDCKSLDADFAAQRIKKFSLTEAIKHSLNLGGSKHKTLVDQFAYPYKGTGMVYEKMCQAILAKGHQIHFNTPVRKVITKQNKAKGLITYNGEVEEFDHVVSSMPISLLIKSMEDVPDSIQRHIEQLKFRSTILVFLLVDGKDLFPDNWLYIHSPDLKMGRITNFRNWVPELYGNKKDTVVAIEYWCNPEDEFWQRSDKDLSQLAKQEIAKTGLLQGCKVKDSFIKKIKRCYPVYEKGYKENLKPIESFLNGIQNLSVIGRYGAFKYNNQDHSILMGLLASSNILENSDHDLWGINTDYENYQEQTVITETGLVVQ